MRSKNAACRRRVAAAGDAAPVRLDVLGLMWPDLAMKRIKIADLKNQLSRHLREVEQGAEIEVTDRRRPIARLVPTRRTASEVRIIPARRPFFEVRDRRHPRAERRIDSLRLLLEERGRR